MNKSRFSVVLGFCLVPYLACCEVYCANAQKEVSKNNSKTSKQSDEQENQIRQLMMSLAKAVNEGSAQKAAALWNQEGIFIDEAGEQFTGRSAIQARFESALRVRTGSAELSLHPETFRFLTPNVAMVVGAVSRKSGSSLLPTTRFTLILTKSGTSWTIDEATETAIKETSAADHLKELDWLIGKWQVDSTGGSGASLEAEWGANRNFVISTCTKSMKSTANTKVVNGTTSQIDRQVIGWDPRTDSIVSWHFDCNGGFGYGKWSKQDDSWVVEFAGVSSSGKSTRATNIFKQFGSEAFTWQSTEQSADGVSVADTAAIKLKRMDK